jgi:hypothetical protein
VRIILDVSADVDNRIEGTVSWANGGGPVEFSGWLALMLLLENAQHGQFETGRPMAAADPRGDQRVADP